ncbi:MAG: hypothetical protein PHO41_02170 [Eubacteriales bacterium]|nr:hypothetical protein [Eubacteriales bacterium]
MSEREQAQAQETESVDETLPTVTDEDLKGPQNAKERFYEKLIRRFHITKKGMDIVLVILGALFLLFFALGALVGNNVI